MSERKGSGDPFFQGIGAIAGGLMFIGFGASHVPPVLGFDRNLGQPAIVQHVQIETGAHQSKQARVELECKGADGSDRTFYATMSPDESRPYADGFATRVWIEDAGKPTERVLTTESFGSARTDGMWLLGSVCTLGLGFIGIGIVLLRRSFRTSRRA